MTFPIIERAILHEDDASRSLRQITTINPLRLNRSLHLKLLRHYTIVITQFTHHHAFSDHASKTVDHAMLPATRYGLVAVEDVGRPR